MKVSLYITTLFIWHASFVNIGIHLFINYSHFYINPIMLLDLSPVKLLRIFVYPYNILSLQFFNYCYMSLGEMLRLFPNQVRLVSNGTNLGNLGLFKISFSLVLRSASKCNLTDLKKPKICPIWGQPDPILMPFDIPAEHRHLSLQTCCSGNSL